MDISLIVLTIAIIIFLLICLIVYGMSPSDTTQKLQDKKNETEKLRLNVQRIAGEINRISTIIEYAFYAETIYDVYSLQKEYVSYISTVEKKDKDFSFSKPSAQLKEEIEWQYNDGLLRAIRRQFSGYKFIMPFLRTQDDINDYTIDMYNRILYAKNILIEAENMDFILSALDDIYFDVEDFSSRFLLMSEDKLSREAERNINYCADLNNLAAELFNEYKNTDALLALNESGSKGDSYALMLLWKYYKKNLDRKKECNILPRLCEIKAVENYRNAQKSIINNPKYKTEIIRAMSYGVNVENSSDINNTSSNIIFKTSLPGYMIDRYIYINGQKYINYYDYQNIEINCKII